MATFRQYRLSKEEFERARAEERTCTPSATSGTTTTTSSWPAIPNSTVAVKDPLGDYEVVATDTNIVSLIDTIEAQGYDRDEIEIERVTDRISAPLGLLLEPR